MNIEDKEYVADERMQLFFKKLLELKEFVKKESENSENSTLNDIYNRLDKIIKEEGK